MNTFAVNLSNSTPIWARMPKIVVLGLGGGGSNAVNRMIESGMQSVTFVAANTDAQALAKNLSPIKIQLGPRSTRGLGAGGLPVVGEAAAEESFRELASILDGAEMVFLTAGMGGGTGTGAIPIAAKIAKSVGAVTIAVVTKPFSFELGRRQTNAENGIQKLRQHVDTLIVIPNDRLIDVAPKDLPLELAFTLADDVLRQGVQGITELVTETGLINVDFAHVKEIMKRGGGALMAIGSGEGPQKAQQAIDNALHHPLLEEIDLSLTSAMIANFTGGSDLSFHEVAHALNILQNQTGNKAEIIPGIINDARMENRVQLILIITGIGGIKIDEVVEVHSQENQIVNPPAPSNNSVHPVFPRRNSHIENQYIRQESQYELMSEESANQYQPEMDLTSNLDVPAFLRKRNHQSSN